MAGGYFCRCTSRSGGATPKDGPSAGGAITLAILSQLSGIPVKHTVAMTGEIDLNGNIKQIGGLVSKLSGAKKAGVTLALIPRENEEDLFKAKSNYRLCIVHSINRDYVLITYDEYIALIQNKRIQYQVNFKTKKD